MNSSFHASCCTPSPPLCSWPPKALHVLRFTFHVSSASRSRRCSLFICHSSWLLGLHPSSPTTPPPPPPPPPLNPRPASSPPNRLPPICEPLLPGAAACGCWITKSISSIFAIW